MHMDQIMAEGGLFLGIEWPILWQKVADDMAVFKDFIFILKVLFFMLKTMIL